ncbi:MAG TPA: hypothetical protein GX726_03735 [Clostridiales bacterium]|jgi:trk system potassium uptake protein TrkH|nr:hypothetical protein [Clostridiales bacterium]
MINPNTIIKSIGLCLMVFAGSLLPATAVSFLYGETTLALRFSQLAVVSLALGAFIRHQTARYNDPIRLREAFMIVTLFWILTGLLGALPYLLSGTVTSAADAVFESFSGFTTTGATIFPHPESLPKGLLFWRSFTEWFGGLLILLFAIVLFPALNINGSRLSATASGDPRLLKLSLKPDQSFRGLIMLYLIFSLICYVALLLCRLNPFDAWLATMSSISTGGFSNYTEGIRYFDSVAVECIVVLFTIVGCINFSLYFLLPKRQFKQFFSDRELRFFLLLLLAAVLLVSANLWLNQLYVSWPQALRYSFFEIIGFLTTGGSGTDVSHHIIWPTFSYVLLIILLLVGSCSNSAGSGIKVIRLIILAKLVARGIRKRLHPRVVQPIKLAGKPVPQDNITNIMTFAYVFVLVFMASAFILSFEPINLATVFAISAATINNAGTVASIITPESSFAGFSAFSKCYLCLVMLLGRLEIFPILLIFTPTFWRPDR